MEVGHVGVVVHESSVFVDVLVAPGEAVGVDVVVVAVVVGVLVVVDDGLVAVRVLVIAAQHEQHAAGGEPTGRARGR